MEQNEIKEFPKFIMKEERPFAKRFLKTACRLLQVLYILLSLIFRRGSSTFESDKKNEASPTATSPPTTFF